MIYTAGKMRLRELRIVRKSPINDIVICDCPDTGDSALYTLLKVKQHAVARNILASFQKAGLSFEDVCVDRFDEDGEIIFVFPFNTERPLSDFFKGENYTLDECEEVCINLILSCITSGMPPAILYLMLRQGQVNIAKDKSVYFNYQIDLTDIDPSKTERDCACMCAGIILEILEPKASQKAISYQLISKKSAKNSYHKFTELYKDVQIASMSKKKKKFLPLIRAFFTRHKDRLFRILLVISCFLVILMILSFIMHAIFGDVIWLRLFINGFKIIGTEHLDIR